MVDVCMSHKGSLQAAPAPAPCNIFSAAAGMVYTERTTCKWLVEECKQIFDGERRLKRRTCNTLTTSLGLAACGEAVTTWLLDQSIGMEKQDPERSL